jgi:hypothetical protein
MNGKTWHGYALTGLFALVALGFARAEDDKKKDEGKAEEFKGKTFDLKEKGKAAVSLAFPAGREATVTVRSEKKTTDVHLFVYDAAGKEVAKDDSPGPSCDLKFTPKGDGKYTLEVRNLGPGDNQCTLKVQIAKKERNP